MSLKFAEEDTLKLLSEACNWTEDDLLAKLHILYEHLINYLSTEVDYENGPQAIHFSMDNLLPNLSFQDERFGKLLKQGLSSSNQLTTSLLSKEDNDFSNIQFVQQILQSLTMILEACEIIIQILLQRNLNEFGISNCFFLLNKCFNINKSILNFCYKKNDYLCQEMCDNFCEDFGSLIQSGIKLHCLIIDLIPKIPLKLWEEEHKHVLKIVIIGLAEIGEKLSQLSEMRNCVSSWRLFTQLIQQYHNHLITEIDITVPVKILVNEIQDGLKEFSGISLINGHMSNDGQKIGIRILKMSSFCLKIILVIADKFKGYTSGCSQHILKLLRVLYQFSGKSKLMANYPTNIRKEAENQLGIGIESFIEHFKTSKEFAQSVLNEEDLPTDESSLIILTTILKCLIKDQENKDIWHPKLIILFFKCFQNSHAQLSIPIRVPGIMYDGKAQRQVSLYEHSSIIVSSYIASLNKEEFQHINSILLEILMTGRLWEVLFVCDQFCFIARYGTSDLCRDYCNTFLKLLQNIPRQNIQHCYISFLLNRLISFMNETDRQILAKQLMANTNENLKTFLLPALKILDAELCSLFEKDLLNRCDQQLKSINSLSSISDIKLLEENLLYISYLYLDERSQNTEIKKTTEKSLAYLLDLWYRINATDTKATVFDQYFQWLIKATCFMSEIQLKDLNAILIICRNNFKMSTINTKLCISRLMTKAVKSKYLKSTNDKLTFKILADLIHYSLSDEHIIVRETGKEIYAEFFMDPEQNELIYSHLHELNESYKDLLDMYTKKKMIYLPQEYDLHTFYHAQIRKDELQCERKATIIELELNNDEFFSLGDIPIHSPPSKKQKMINEEVGSSNFNEIFKLLNTCSDLLSSNQNAKYDVSEKSIIVDKLQSLLDLSRIL